MFHSYCSAEIFTWTDKNGQVHYSDQPHANTQAQKISIDSSKINIASELSTPDLLQRFAEEKDATNRKLALEQEVQQKKKPSKAKWCKDARKQLRKITGRVVFLDGQGNPANVSEEERKRRVANLGQSIQKNCP